MATTTEGAAHDLEELAQNLRDLGETGLRKELLAAIRHATAAIPPIVRTGLGDYMPDRYAGVLEPDLQMGSSTHTTGPDVGVTVYVRARTGGKQRRVARLNRGIIWHPVFADVLLPRRTWTWRIQETPSVKPGFFSDPVENAAPRVRDDIVAAMDRVRDEIWRGVH